MKLNVSVATRFGKETAASINHCNDDIAKNSLLMRHTPGRKIYINSDQLNNSASKKDQSRYN